MLRDCKLRVWLEFYSAMYKYIDNVDYQPGIARLYKCIPVKLQAHMYDIAEGTELPDSSMFMEFKYNLR